MKTEQNLYRLINSIEGWLTLNEANFLYITAKNTGGIIVEIGSYQGKSTVCIGKGLQDGKGGKVYAIDPHLGSTEHKIDGKDIWTFDKFKENIRSNNVENSVEPIVKTSEDAVKGWDKPIDFLFIDGAHDYENVKKDFELWSPYLKSDGIIAFHDANAYAYLQGADGPLPVVKDFILKNPDYKNISLISSTIRAEKTARLSIFDLLQKKFFYLFLNLKIIIAFIRLKLLKKI